jgi:hypothetical protein
MADINGTTGSVGKLGPLSLMAGTMRNTVKQNAYDIMTQLGQDDPTLSVLATVLNDFNQKSIGYCYWKSSRRVHCSVVGEGDVDLLVASSDQHHAQTILFERGFKLFPYVAYRDHPAMVSYVGYDEPSERLIHVHLHFRLVVGEVLLKNYRLPWETSVLARSTLHPMLPIRLLDPTTEALLLVVRAGLELRRIDPVTLRRWNATTQRFAADRQELRTRVDRAALWQRAAELLNEDLADMVTASFFSERALEHQGRLRRRLRRHLAPYRTFNTVEARIRMLGRAVLWTAGVWNKHYLRVPRPWSRRAPGGGAVAALIGVDGSGKSTTVAAIRAWLGSEVDVLPMYYGTGHGRPSLLLLPFKQLVPLVTMMIKQKPKGASHGKISNEPPTLLYSVLLMVWATIVAVEKRVKLVAARRGANRGLIVLADRYPQNEILRFNDGPLLHRLPSVPLWLRRFEAAAYALAHRMPPDLVIKLKVMPETVAKREPDMHPEIIRARVLDVGRIRFPGARVVCVDAEQPAADVIRAVKREIWRML